MSSLHRGGRGRLYWEGEDDNERVERSEVLEILKASEASEEAIVSHHHGQRGQAATLMN